MLKFIKYLSNLKDAFRVLEIMDKCGCDIEQCSEFSGNEEYWIIKPKWYVSKQEAKNLQMICLHHQHYKKTSKLFHKLFCKHIKYGYRYTH